MQQIIQIIRIENSSIYLSRFLISEANLNGGNLFELKNCLISLFEHFYLENLFYNGQIQLQAA